MNSSQDDWPLRQPGCPIRRSPDQSLLSGSPKLIAANHALHRLLAPRHPPCALSSLTIKPFVRHVGLWSKGQGSKQELLPSCPALRPARSPSARWFALLLTAPLRK